MKVRIAALVVLTLSAATGAGVAPTAQDPLAAVKALKCSFPVYASARWAERTPEALTGTDTLAFQIDSIDYKRRSARIVATGAALATLLHTSAGLNVIEQTPAGNLTVTTVFAGGGVGTTFLAVHSRHLGETNAPPRLSQYYGTCELAP